MDSTHSSIPFDPDFDAEVNGKATEQQTQTQTMSSTELSDKPFSESSYQSMSGLSSGTSPVLTFYLGLASSVLVFGLVGIIWILVWLS